MRKWIPTRLWPFLAAGLGFLSGFGSRLQAAVVPAGSCDGLAVQAAVNTAVDGDTVTIPAGTCHWTSGITMTPRAITVQGAGIDQTILVDDIPKTGSNDVLLVANTQEGKSFRLMGLTIQGGNTATGWDGAVVIGGTSKNWRVDHVKFDQPKTEGVRIYGDTYGVIDHCIFNLNGTQGIVLWHEAWGGYTYGNGSYYEGLHLGTEKAVYIEDNTFVDTQKTALFDSEAGGRVVFRYNTIINDYFVCHGTDSSLQYRSIRSYEISLVSG